MAAMICPVSPSDFKKKLINISIKLKLLNEAKIDIITHRQVYPPSMTNSEPVTYLDSSEAK